MGIEVLLILLAGGTGYGVTWGVDRRQKPSLIVGGAVGAVAAVLSLVF